MKRTLFIVTLLVLCIGCLQGKSLNFFGNEEPEKIELTRENKSDGERERGITNTVVQAFLLKDLATIHVDLYNIGTATVTIMNSAGEITCSTSANTALPVTLNLQLPGEDSYFIEIASSEYYASGFFTL